MNIQDYLKKMVHADTRYIHKNENNLSEWLKETLETYGFSCHLVTTDGRHNILADNKKDGKAILFYGHIDTVDIVPGWTKNPLELTIEGDRAYGLGAYDMKGGIAAILCAVASSEKHVKILLAVDEENISQGSWDVVKHKKTFFTDVELIISAEPNFGFGLHGLTIGRTGRVIFQVSSQGKAVHIAKYKEGLNAIYPLVEFLHALKKARIGKDKMTVVQPREINTHTVGMSVCDSAICFLEVQIGGDDSIENISTELAQIATNIQGKLTVSLAARVTPYLSGYRFNHFPYQKEIAEIVETKTKHSIKLHERSSVGDDNVLATFGIPVLTWGPDGNGAHEADEWVSLSSLEALSDMYQKLLEKSCS